MRNHQQLMALLTALAMSFATDKAMANTPVQACEITVYFNDTDPNGMHVRAGPGANYSRLQTITDSDAQFDITGSAGKWLRIRQVRAIEGGVIFKGEGWVFAPLTAIRSKGDTLLRTMPTDTAALAGNMASEESGAIQSCQGQWVQIQGKVSKGWMPPGTFCGNPVSDCV
jgi:SH3-like domain-containing protein